MSDGLLAAIIAAGATVFASFLQLRTALAKELAGRGSSAPSRRKNRLSLILLIAMLGGAGVGGFALAQWLHEYERVAQDALQRDLRERIADLSRTRIELEQSRATVRADAETDMVRRLGTEGVVVLATVPPCKAPRAASAPTLTVAVENGTSSPASQPQATGPAPACVESDASPIMLCATIPATAKVTDIDLYVRGSDSAGPWTPSRALAGQEIEQARFTGKPVEVAEGSSVRQVCEGFAQWSDHARVARVVVHFSP